MVKMLSKQQERWRGARPGPSGPASTNATPSRNVAHLKGSDLHNQVRLRPRTTKLSLSYLPASFHTLANFITLFVSSRALLSTLRPRIQRQSTFRLRLLPMGMSVQPTRLSLHWGTDDNVEDIDRYVAGGYHPVRLGDTLRSDVATYRILHKLGRGSFATVWLAATLENAHSKPL